MQKSSSNYMDESIRRRLVAEEKVAEGKISEARNSALIAQQLLPEQDGLSLLLALLDVLHVIQQNKDSVQSSWHKILQVDAASDIATIWKQYHRLCLFLHPERNKLIRGNYDAFNLVTEAWKVACLKISNQSTVDNNVGLVSEPDLSIADATYDQKLTFWTICPSCETLYEHLTIYENRYIFCSICKAPFVAVASPLPDHLEESLTDCIGFGSSQTEKEDKMQMKNWWMVKCQGKEAEKNPKTGMVKSEMVNEVDEEFVDHVFLEEECHNVMQKSVISDTCKRGKEVEKENQRPRKSPRLMAATCRPGMNKEGNYNLKALSHQLLNVNEVTENVRELEKHLNGRKHKIEMSSTMNAQMCKRLNAQRNGVLLDKTCSARGSLVGKGSDSCFKQVGKKARRRCRRWSHSKRQNQLSKKSLKQVAEDNTNLQDDFLINQDKLENLSKQIAPVQEETYMNTLIKRSCMPCDGMDKVVDITEVAKVAQHCNPDSVLSKVFQNTTAQTLDLDKAIISTTCYKQNVEGLFNAGTSQVDDDGTDTKVEMVNMQDESDHAHRLTKKLIERLRSFIFDGFSQVDDSLRNVNVIDVKGSKASNHKTDAFKTQKDNEEKGHAFESVQINLSVSFTYSNFSSDGTTKGNQEQYGQQRCLESVPGDVEDPKVVIPVADTQFFEFDKGRREDCFAAGQIWAIYDDDDGMPRYYARISKVLSVQPFNVEMVWLSAESKNDFSCICGDFKLGICVSSEHVNVFSHKMQWKRGARKSIRIYPQKGDVWALYKGWFPSQKAKERTYEYDIVEIISGHNEASDITVVLLLKVEGFRTLFQKLGHEFEYSLSKKELGRFSHKIPVYRLAEDEAPGLVEGCMELDTAATTWIT